VGLPKKELASNRSHRPASQSHHHLDLFSLRILTMCNPDGLAFTSVVTRFRVNNIPYQHQRKKTPVEIKETHDLEVPRAWL
jgi:hypothetical protein